MYELTTTATAIRDTDEHNGINYSIAFYNNNGIPYTITTPAEEYPKEIADTCHYDFKAEIGNMTFRVENKTRDIPMESQPTFYLRSHKLKDFNTINGKHADVFHYWWPKSNMFAVITANEINWLFKNEYVTVTSTRVKHFQRDPNSEYEEQANYDIFPQYAHLYSMSNGNLIYSPEDYKNYTDIIKCKRNPPPHKVMTDDEWVKYIRVSNQQAYYTATNPTSYYFNGLDSPDYFG